MKLHLPKSFIHSGLAALAALSVASGFLLFSQSKPSSVEAASTDTVTLRGIISGHSTGWSTDYGTLTWNSSTSRFVGTVHLTAGDIFKVVDTTANKWAGYHSDLGTSVVTGENSAIGDNMVAVSTGYYTISCGDFSGYDNAAYIFQTATGSITFSNGYTITEYAVVDGGLNSTALATETAIPGTAFTPTDPTAPTGLTFNGWYTDSACTTSYTSTTYTAAGTLYAKFTGTASVAITAHVWPGTMPSGVSSENTWAAATTIYLYAFGSTYNSGIMAMSRNDSTSNWTLSISPYYTKVIFLTVSGWPSTSYLCEQTEDCTIPDTTLKTFKVSGSTVLTSKSTGSWLTTSDALPDTTTSTLYIKNTLSITPSAVYVHCWDSGSTYVHPYYETSDELATLNGSYYTFPVSTYYDRIKVVFYYDSTYYPSSDLYYNWTNVDSHNPVYLNVYAYGSTYINVYWDSEITHAVDSANYDTVNVPLPSSSFFRVWMTRPSLAFGSSATYESTYLWSLEVSSSPLGTNFIQVLPSGYVTDGSWLSTASGYTSTARIFSFYDVPITYRDYYFQWICYQNWDGNQIVTGSVSTTSLASSVNASSQIVGNANPFYLTCSSGLSYSQGAVDYVHPALLKYVLQGYLSCSSDGLNGYGRFNYLEAAYFSTATTQFARVTSTNNTQSSTSDGQTLLTGLSLVDYSTEQGSAAYSSGSPSGSTTAYAKYVRMYNQKGLTLFGTMAYIGPDGHWITPNSGASSFSLTLIIVASSGTLTLLFIGALFLYSRKKKRRPIPLR